MTSAPRRRAVKPATSDAKRDRSVPLLPLHDRLRWDWSDCCAAVGLAENTIRAMIHSGEFPPPIDVRGTTRQQFAPGEIRIWAEGGNWKALVERRLQPQGVS